MSDILGVAWRTVAFGWRFGSALVTAAIASVVGVLVGFVGFVVPMRLPPHAQVLLRPGQHPALVSKLWHYADAEFTGLADG